VASAAAYYDALPLARRGIAEKLVHHDLCEALPRLGPATSMQLSSSIRVDVGRCFWARSAKGRIARAPGARGKSAAQLSAHGRARALGQASCHRAIPVWARRGLASRSAPKNRTPPLPESGQNGPRQANVPACQGADLRVCVELRGFEPLTFSMRTEYSGEQNRCLRALLHVRALG